MIKFSQVIICRVRVSILLTSALCVIVVRRRWTIFCYIVRRLICYGASSLDLLGFHGFYEDQLQIFFLVGGIG